MAAVQAGCSEDKVVTSVDLYFMQVAETRFKLASETRDLFAEPAAMARKSPPTTNAKQPIIVYPALVTRR